MTAGPAWSRTGNPCFPVAARVDGAWWVLRLNGFPSHPLWTLFVDGVCAGDVDDAPAGWGDPARHDHPPLTPDEAAAVLKPVSAFVAYGSECGDPCTDPYCCG